MKRCKKANNIPNFIKKELANRYKCYVLITCSEPSTTGELDVEMSHDGDNFLISYLLNSAQEVIDRQL